MLSVVTLNCHGYTNNNNTNNIIINIAPGHVAWRFCLESYKIHFALVRNILKSQNTLITCRADRQAC